MGEGLSFGGTAMQGILLTERERFFANYCCYEENLISL